MDVLDFLRSQPALVVFLVIGFGYLFDRIRVAGVQLGASTGVLFAGLILGHLGLQGSGGSQSIGFMLFIYCVGLRAGPQFFRAFREQGLRFAVLAVVVCACGIASAVLLGRQLGLPPGYAAGLLAGALTCTPSLVASQDAVRQGMAVLPPGVEEATVLGNIAASYAISYVIGLFGLMVFVSVLPRLMGIDLQAEARRLASEPAEGGAAPAPPSYGDMPDLRVYAAARPVPAAEIAALRRAGCLVQAMKRAGVVVDATPGAAVEPGDLVAVLGLRAAQRRCQEVLGAETVDDDLLQTKPVMRTILVTGSRESSRATPTIDLAFDRHCLVLRITRAGVALPVAAGVALAKGDLVVVVGTPSNVDALARQLGRSELPESEADLVTFAFGIAAGIAIGLLTMQVGGITFGLGSAGGLLLSGLFVGWARTVNPTFGQLPVAATSVLQQLGLLFFIANVGLEAGASVAEALRTTGPWLPIAAFVVMATPVLVGFAVGRLVLGFDPVILLGALTGALTSTPGLDLVNRQAGSPLPTLGYAGTYAFASVIMTIAGSAMMRL